MKKAIFICIFLVALIGTASADFSVCGDVNRDGEIDGADITGLRNYVREQAPLSCVWCADVNCDGEIDAADITALRYFVNEQAPLSCCPPPTALVYNGYEEPLTKQFWRGALTKQFKRNMNQTFYLPVEYSGKDMRIIYFSYAMFEGWAEPEGVFGERWHGNACYVMTGADWRELKEVAHSYLGCDEATSRGWGNMFFSECNGCTIIYVDEAFSTGEAENPYPSIAGTHLGTFTPTTTITVTQLFSYACEGTAGHVEYIRIHGNGVDESATWDGYTGEWHRIVFPTSFILASGETYNYEITTGSYPQIHHVAELMTTNGVITCTSFTDVNNYIWYNWIPAIMLC